MKKANFIKTVFLLWGLIAGGGIAQAEAYECVKVNNLSEIEDNDQVLLVDKSRGLALSNSGTYELRGVEITIGNDNTSVIRVTANMKWTIERQGDNSFRLKNNDEYLWGSLTTPSVSVSSTPPADATNMFVLENYGKDGGKLYYEGNNGNAYFCWSTNNNKLISIDESTTNRFTLYKIKIKTYVKWKRVQNPANLAAGDTTVIVDLTSSNAMKNNPAYEEGKTVSKEAPSAMKVTLKEELDRLTCEIGDTLEWKADRSGNKNQFYEFYINNNEGNRRYLFNSDQALRVGFVSTGNASKRAFDINKGLLHQYVESDEGVNTHYHVGFKQASGIQSFMGGSTWDLGAQTDDGKVNADIAATKMAFFRKVRTNKPDPMVAFPEHDYEADVQNPNDFDSPVATVEEGAGVITYWSDNENVATVNSSTGEVTLKQRGTVRIYAQVDETADYDDYLTSYILRIDDTSKDGSRAKPFTVAEAIAYAKAVGHEEETANGVCYFVKGIVSSVGGMMAGMEGMEDLMDMFSGLMGETSTGGFDMSAMLGMFMGEQEEGAITYAISDNGVDRDSLSVINGRGLKLADITADSLSVGDRVTVYGPLEYSEDQDMMSMFGGMGGNNNNNNTEDKRTVKMPRVNYMQEHTRNLITETVVLYYGETKTTEDLFSITDMFGGSLVTNQNATNKKLPMTSLKLSDTDFAEWVLNEAKTDSVLVPKMEGIITVTVNAPVLLQPGDTVKMKRKFYLDVRDRRVLPAGAMEGVYELVTNANQLKADDKLLIVATIDDKPKVLNRKVGGTGGGGIMSLFGGSGNSSNITIDEDGRITQVPDDAMILNLEQTDGKWSLQTGRTADYKMTYLYISDTDGGGFGGGSIPGMGGGAKLKTGKLENIEDSCQVTFTFPANKNDSVQIKFNFADREKDGNTTVAKNVIRYGKSMMSSSFGGYEADSEEGTLPRLYRLVHPSSFDVAIDESGWTTIVPYTDVTMPEELEAYVVTKVVTESDRKVANITPVEAMKGGEPYLLHSKNEGDGTFALTVSGEEVAKPRVNKLKISDETAEVVYVLANTNGEVGFYEKNEILGAGYVYLPSELGAGQKYIPFVVNEDPFPGITTGISEANGKGTTSDRAYDLQGRRVSVTKGQVKKGLYIINGKKVVIK